MCTCSNMLIRHRIVLLMRFTYRAKVSTLDYSYRKVNSRAPFRLELTFISLITSLLGTLSLKVSRFFLHPQGKVGKGWKRAGSSERFRTACGGVTSMPRFLHCSLLPFRARVLCSLQYRIARSFFFLRMQM